MTDREQVLLEGPGQTPGPFSFGGFCTLLLIMFAAWFPLVCLLVGLSRPAGWGDVADSAASVASTSAEPVGEAREADFVLPILMYHRFKEPVGPGWTRFAMRYTVSPEEFEKQLRFLRDTGRVTIDTSDLAAFLRGERALPERAVMLTFDDGWREQHDVVLPLLQRYSMVGVFFVHTGAIASDERVDDPARVYMTWGEVCDLQRAGMDVQSHTVTHPSLPRLEPADLDRELVDSRRMLESRLGRPVEALAYPNGDFSPRVIEAARRAGYGLAFTTEVGIVHDAAEPLEIRRGIVLYSDTLDDLALKLEDESGERMALDYAPSIVPSRP